MRWTQQEYDAYQNRRGRSLQNAKQRERPQALARDNEGEAQGPGCVPVGFKLYRVRLLDVDAKYASVKDLLDCLVAAGFVDGDQEGQVSLYVCQEKVRTKAEERTVIDIQLPAAQSRLAKNNFPSRRECRVNNSVNG